MSDAAVGPIGTAGRLSGRTALVTGSTRGIGRTIAEWLAREGASIVVSGRDQRAVDETIAALQATGVAAFGIAADLSRVDEAHRLADATVRRVERLDILVNNAGMSLRGHFWEVTDAAWEEQVNVNLRSPFILAQHVTRQMIERGVRGRIVNVGTIGARLCHTDAAVYDFAKAAVEAMTRNMAYELGPYGVSVNCVVPGNIAERPSTDPSDDAKASWARHIPFGRVGRAEDVAAAVLFFCLPESAFTTGQSLLVDGAHGTYLTE